ncbi:MAG: HAMP domain-containing histidine kinase [FCB group bacterium]|nr:HAMP domain-containing histidine kinase [FCB group bacterium]
MNEEKKTDIELIMWENSLAFFGAITASVSHEMNNILSIIDQTNGLLDDLLYGVSQGGEISEQRLRRISDGIANQTQRGVRIVKRLNTFAHSVDDPMREFDAVNLIDNFARLAQRLASLKKVELVTESLGLEVKVKTSPFLLQQALFLLIQRALGCSDEGDTVEIRTMMEESEVIIEVEGSVFDHQYDSWDAGYMKKIVDLIGAEHYIIEKDDREIYRLALPKH